MSVIYDLTKEYLGYVIGTIGILIGAFGIIRSRKFKKPAFITKTFRIIGHEKELSMLAIAYGNRIVKTLSITRVAVFNNGNQVIDVSDVAKKDPLRIGVSKNSKIFGARFSYVKNEANGFSLKIDEERNFIEIEFEYMNGGDGCVIEIIHGGVMSDGISVTGSFKGVGKVQKSEVISGTLWRRSFPLFLIISISAIFPSYFLSSHYFPRFFLPFF